MSGIYVNTTRYGVSNSAIEMGDIEPPKEVEYKNLQFKHSTPQRQTEPARMDRMGPTKSSVSRKATLLQCSVVILFSLAVSTISGVVVYMLTKEDMKDMQLEIQSSSSALSKNLKGTMSSNITILNNKLDGVESEQSQLADRFDERSTSISAFTATEPAYYGKSSFTNYSTLNFSRTIYNLGGDFNSSTGMLTCTKPGTYQFSVFLVKKKSSNRTDKVYCYLYKKYFNIIRTKVDPTDDDTDKGNAQAANSAVIHLNTGDVVYLRYCSSASYMESWSSFSGFLLYPDA